MEKLIKYIIRFLLADEDSSEVGDLIGYTAADFTDNQKYRIIFVPSGFFDNQVYGSEKSLPTLPLKEICNIPLLFGHPEIKDVGGQLIIHADIIASTYFLLSRYEEYVRKEVRDIHGRFPGKESLPYKVGFIDRPIVDEYGKLLRSWLRKVGIDIQEPKSGLNKIYLTHDIDIPFLYKGRIKSTLKGLLTTKNQKTILKSFFGKKENDPAFTFPWLIEQDNQLKQLVNQECEVVYFFKTGGKTQQDKPVYDLHSKDIQELIDLCKKSQAALGLHSSYDAGMHPALIKKELKALELATNVTIKYNRHHFLNCREPEDMQYLVEAGISDDFTMGYADVAGFRLGTCRAVSWINPIDKMVYPLTLHPLTIMECTLDQPYYMNLNYDEAIAYCKSLIDQVYLHNGDLVLLWHNNNIIELNNLYSGLYKELLNYIKQCL